MISRSSHRIIEDSFQTDIYTDGLKKRLGKLAVVWKEDYEGKEEMFPKNVVGNIEMTPI